MLPEDDLRGVLGEEATAMEVFEPMLKPKPTPKLRLWDCSKRVSRDSNAGRSGLVSSMLLLGVIRTGIWYSVLVGVSGPEVLELEEKAGVLATERSMGGVLSKSSVELKLGPLSSGGEDPKRKSFCKLILENRREDLRLAVVGVGEAAWSRAWSCNETS
jgi:hypothetical protein